MKEDDKDLFRQEMKGVTSLEQTNAYIGKKPGGKEVFTARKKAAESFSEPADTGLSTFNRKRVQPHDVVGYKVSGVQEGVYRQLRLGKYSPDARLDLHGLSVEAARIAIKQFVDDAMACDARTVLIVHGKGDRESGNKAILKNLCIQWLEETAEVLAFHSAQKRDGGAGALYVLLKKSERAKQKNRDLLGIKS